MNFISNKLFLGGLIGLGALVAFIVFSGGESGPAKLDSFAQCLGESGATFYGAFWCPHCQNQKALFGSSEKFLPYTECSTVDGRGQTAVCKQAGIEGYPTWEFADGSRESGEVSLERLSQKTNCPLPS